MSDVCRFEGPDRASHDALGVSCLILSALFSSSGWPAGLALNQRGPGRQGLTLHSGLHAGSRGVAAPLHYVQIGEASASSLHKEASPDRRSKSPSYVPSSHLHAAIVTYIKPYAFPRGGMGAQVQVAQKAEFRQARRLDEQLLVLWSDGDIWGRRNRHYQLSSINRSSQLVRGRAGGTCY